MFSGESYHCCNAHTTDITTHFDPFPLDRSVRVRFEYPVVFYTANNIVWWLPFEKTEFGITEVKGITIHMSDKCVTFYSFLSFYFLKHS